jgi:hypothetical protein
MAYSERINDPAFAQYVKNTHRWTWIFSIAIALIAVIGFFIYGQTSAEMDNPQALYIGFGIGGMFLVIALFRSIGYRRGKTWDGVVTGKDIQDKRVKKYTSDENYYWDVYEVYNVFVRDEQGNTHTIRTERDDTVYNYYKIGDKVRYHGSLHTYEKYDKSQDTIIFCNACSTLHDIQDDVCARCKCPLLK